MNTILRCSQCGAPYASSNLDRARRLASCANCGGISRIEGEDDGRPIVPRPAHFAVGEDEHRLVVTWRWRDAVAYFFIAFTLVWVAVPTMWVETHRGRLGGELVLVGAIVGLTGLALAYASLARLFNHTEIELNQTELLVKHGPMPWPGQVRRALNSIDQLYCERLIRRDSDGATTTSYTLYAMLRGGEKVRILSGQANKADVYWLENALEQRMGIRDRPVDGEVEKHRRTESAVRDSVDAD